MTTATTTPTPTTRPPIGRPPIGPVVELLLPQSWREELDAIAEELATTRAVVIRDALEVAYGDRLPKAYRGASVIGGAGDRKATRSRARKAALDAIAALEADSTTDSTTHPTVR